MACVSAAVSDESVAGDSGVYEASVQRWVPESWACSGVWEGPTGGWGGRRSFTSGRLPVSPSAIKGRVARGASIGERTAPSREGSGVALGRQGPQGGSADPNLLPQESAAPSQREPCLWKMTLAPGHCRPA